jgi:FkbM family methyltransferase
MLADLCFRIQFPTANPEYILIEPNPKLVKVIRRNLHRSGLCPRHLIHRGLVGGARAGSATLWLSPRNYLSASLVRGPKTRGVEASFFDLESLVKSRTVDLLKVDIEGAEFDFVEDYRELLCRTQAVMIEVHDAAEARKQRLFSRLDEVGLRLRAAPIENSGSVLASFQRW